MLVQLTAFADNASEKFDLDVGMLSEKQIQSTGQKFYKIDLRSLVNRDIKDDVPGDHKGGWSDQGDNDLRKFDKFGSEVMLGVPFDFIDPDKNGRKAVLGLRGQNDTGLPTSVEVPVSRVTAGAYFVQASPFCSGTCGRYTWVYEDGTEAYMDIVQNVHICDFWGRSSYDYVRPVWSTSLGDGSMRSLYLFAMNNPYPEKKVKSLKLSTDGGGAYIMIMAITLTDKGPYLSKTSSSESITTSTFGWYGYTQPDDAKVSGSALDFSSYLDAPAGKHGYVKADGELLKFGDGTAAKFWGADIIGGAAFPEKTEADRAAERIAHCGINLIRFSHIEEGFDEQKKDKLYYFVSRLKEKGVYSYISAFSGDSDGIGTYFDKVVIEKKKDFLNSLMNSNNPYTGMALSRDPAVCMLELVDSLSVFDYGSGYGANAAKDGAQRDELDRLFNEFLTEKYQNDAKLSKAWTSVYDKQDNEKLELMNIKLGTKLDNRFVSNQCRADAAEFMKKLAKSFYAEMKSVLKNSEIMITINSPKQGNMTAAGAALSAETDFIVGKSFNAAPFGTSDFITEDSSFEQYGSMTKNKQNMISQLACGAPADKPYIANWGSAMPNLYFSEASVMTAAFSAQKNWSAIQHSFANEKYSDKNYIDDFYSIYNNPVRLALAPVAAALYYNFPSEKTKVQNVGEEISAGKEKTDGLIPDSGIFKANTRIKFSAKSDNAMKSSPNVYKTNNIYMDFSLGLFEARCDTGEVVSGFLNGAEELPTFTVDADNSFVTAALISLDGKKLSSSDHMLFTALCGNQNYKSRVNLIRNRYDSLGEEKIVVEAITGSAVIKATGNYEIYPLTSSGERKAPLTVTKTSLGYTKFELASSNEAIQYEIVRK